MYYKLLILFCLFVISCSAAFAQQDIEKALLDSLERAKTDRPVYADQDTLVINDSILKKSKVKMPRDWANWKPDPKKALWLALVVPGGGQIYNRKYWKLPIFYGGFVGCIYALRWNGMMYKDYSQAYMDIMDDDPNTASYNQFLHLGTTINSSNIERYKNIFKSRKDKYRRWRDLAFFCMIGVYAISVIDAYVDAQLSDFDISRDLSMKVTPKVMMNKYSTEPLKSTAVGVQCSLKF